MYNRVLLKISGEALAGEKKTGIDPVTIGKIADQIKEVASRGIKLGVVTGGGNFWRARDGYDIERTTSDYMGMLATVLNALALKDALITRNVKAVVQSSIEMVDIAEKYTKRDLEMHLKNNEVVIFAAGTGHPYFSTDTCAALRAAEMKAEVILVAKTIGGIYTADPKKDENAKKYDEITYSEILVKGLQAMDLPATTICMENNIPLVVFSIYEPENIIKASDGEKIGTLVK